MERKINKEVKVLFKVAASKEIGMGHVVRSLALANELRKKGADIDFLYNGFEMGRKKILNLGFNCYEEQEDYIQKSMKLFKGYNKKIFINDIKKLNVLHINDMRKNGIYFVQLDITRDWEIPVDLIVNGGIYTKRLYNKNNNKNLFGEEYNLLRSEFRTNKKNNVKQKVKEVLITLGSTDVHNISRKIVEWIDEITNDIIIHVVVSNNNNSCDDYISNENTIYIYKDIENIYDVMRVSDMAIISGGVTLYESACIGLPSLIVIQAKNQEDQAEVFADEGYGINLGNAEKLKFREFKSNFLDLFNDFNKRKKQFEVGISLIDGYGALRVANYILENSGG